MRKKFLGNSDLEVTTITLGCMRMNDWSIKDIGRVYKTALDVCINLLDNEVIYGGGESEQIFAEAFQSTSATRENIYIQSKTGIRDGYFDFSKDHILQSVDGSLQRLNTDYLDVLLLHRPDTLVE